jgi:predicted Holliday junction resolvase-like endonuclease
METLLIALVSLLLVMLFFVLLLLLRPREADVKAIEDLEKKLRFALASADSVKEVQEMVEELPRDVMRSITGSLGKRTGKLNELMATFELTQYDRLFYLGDPIDFVGIRYDESVDFIEVKTNRFRLTEDERKLRELVEAGRVNYVPLLVERIGIAEEG